jgi:hypothetical protein
MQLYSEKLRFKLLTSTLAYGWPDLIGYIITHLVDLLFRSHTIKNTANLTKEQRKLWENARRVSLVREEEVKDKALTKRHSM